MGSLTRLTCKTCGRRGSFALVRVNGNFACPRCMAERELWPNMSEAQRLAHHADVPSELAEMVVSAAARIGVNVREFRGESRRPHFVAERRRIALAAREHGHSYPTIGRALNRDHSTIHTCVRRASAI